MDLFDLTIIGGGPTGLFAAYYSGLRGMKTKILDALPQLGGQLTALYPEKYIYDVAGLPKVLAKDLASDLVQQSLQYGPEVCLGKKITAMEILTENGRNLFKLTNESGQQHHTKAILLTVGIGAFAPRKLSLPDAKRYEDSGVLYFVQNKSLLKDKKLLIVGGGDSALDWVLNLEGVAKDITLIHRRDQFRAHEDSVKKLFESKAKIKLFYELKALHGNPYVEAATIYHNRTKEEETLPVDFILLNLGFIANLGAIKQWGLEIEKNDVKVTSKMETNIPGIYAAGDIVVYPGKLKLIATGFGEATVAVNAVKSYIDPSAKFFPGHSSDMAPPPAPKKP